MTDNTGDAVLRAEIDRLRNALVYEENRFARQGTHGHECWSWGPSHYECALREIEILKKRQNKNDVLLMQAKIALSSFITAAERMRPSMEVMRLVDQIDEAVK